MKTPLQTKQMKIINVILVSFLLQVCQNVDGFVATYNSFRNQTGFCFQQGYDTVSRSTSNGVPMFKDGRIRMGVGLNDFDFQHSSSMCGACIWINFISHFGDLNDELTEWQPPFFVEEQNFYVMVMDQCTDPICVPGWLDFDIYSPDFMGNPMAVTWEFRPCPVHDNEMIEMLLCTSVSCHPDDAENRHVHDIFETADPTYFSLYIRNHRLPVVGMSLVGHGDLLDLNGWTFTDGRIDWTAPFWDLVVSWKQDADGRVISKPVRIQHALNETTAKGYRGGILYRLDLQN
jgi:hypothetical protein